MRRRCCRPPRIGDPTRAQLPLLPADGMADPAGTASGRIAAGPPPPEAAAPPGHRPSSPRRMLAILLPRLPAERRRRPGPVAIWAQRGTHRVLVSISREAEAAGLREGQALADAQAVLPGVVLLPEDPAGDAAALQKLALWALRFTPLVGVEGRDCLLLDITGVGHLFGGEAALREQVLDRLACMGLTALGAVADGAGPALALVRGGWSGVLPAGREAAMVARLSLAALGLEAPLIGALHALGLRDVGSVAAQPRAGLVRRFGPGLARALDEALGRAARPVSPIRPPPEMRTAQDFADPVVTREGIEAALGLLLQSLCRAMHKAGRGARRLLLRAHRVDGDVQEIAIGTGLPSRDPGHLARLFREKLERLEPDCGFERLVLEAGTTEPLHGVQDGLGTAGRATRREELAQLLDRLSQRLPVWRLAPRASHWPERAMQRVGAFEEVRDFPGWAARPRPVRLLRRPPFIGAVALLPDAPPSLLRIGRQSHRVLRAEGPERFEPEWWRDRPDRKPRDYYRVELASGARLWVCRIGLTQAGEEPRWALHGHLP